MDPQLRRLLLISLFCYAATTVLMAQACAPGRQVPVVSPMSYEPIRLEEVMPSGLVDDGGVPVRRGIPHEPSEFQKRPPCDVDADERAIRGACYQRAGRKPPCGEKLREHEGECYRALGLPKGPPVSDAP